MIEPTNLHTICLFKTLIIKLLVMSTSVFEALYQHRCVEMYLYNYNLD